jgi:hypothetical protein
VPTTSSTLSRRSAPEQGTRPGTVNRTIKLRRKITIILSIAEYPESDLIKDTNMMQNLILLVVR